MAVLSGIREKWNNFTGRLRTVMAPVDRVFGVIGKVIDFIFTWLYRLRGILISVPVAWAAWKLALYNKEHLPEKVGLNLLSTGEFERMIPMQGAVMGPFYVTVACLVMVLLSRKTLYPWIISVFTLTIPLLLLLTNNMQALKDLFSIVISYFTAA